MSTTFASRTYAAAFVTTFTTLVRAAAERTASVAKIMVNRWMAKQLCDFTDHELADIGLTRYDLRVALDGPLHADPSLRLAAIARGNSANMSSAVLRRAESVNYTPLVRGREE
ncbi:DUF1127 domain-containing protein [Pleomorphomonas sp. JP5]|uniref:DUF1127 domain-containing protein n=1 Tax=Pleomorphomonas sp. JP5 TaxID=2942998 RepID=UPI0020447522|nr:DUF1127 domain-containing protein [Pleomorphomonas sp. JP5]MCM5559123.1 DUF1127 domain-containing protein [Pleomorphomonas sp. JP5]